MRSSAIFLLAVAGLLCSQVREGTAQHDFMLVAWSGSFFWDGIWQFFPHNSSWHQMSLGAPHVGPGSVGYDPVWDKVFWTDHVFRWLNWANVDGTSGSTLAVFPGQVEGLKVEPSSRSLFYTQNPSVLAKQDLVTRAITIIHNNLDNPREIALDCPSDTIYWADWGGMPRIEQSFFNGTGRKTFFQNNTLMHNRTLQYTNGIHLDDNATTMYVCDVEHVNASYFQTHYYEIDVATGLVNAVKTVNNSRCYHIETNDTHMFIADWYYGLTVAPLHFPENWQRVSGQPGSGYVMGIHYEHATKTPGSCTFNKTALTTTTTAATTTVITTPSSGTNSDSQGSKVFWGYILAGILGGLLLIVLIVIIVFIAKKNNRTVGDEHQYPGQYPYLGGMAPGAGVPYPQPQTRGPRMPGGGPVIPPTAGPQFAPYAQVFNAGYYQPPPAYVAQGFQAPPLDQKTTLEDGNDDLDRALQPQPGLRQMPPSAPMLPSIRGRGVLPPIGGGGGGARGPIQLQGGAQPSATWRSGGFDDNFVGGGAAGGI